MRGEERRNFDKCQLRHSNIKFLTNQNPLVIYI